MKEQFEILRQMQEDGYNVVTCGNCGDVVLLEIKIMKTINPVFYPVFKDFLEEVQCPHCKETMDYCDMPDLYSQKI